MKPASRFSFSLFVEEKLGKQFVENRAVPFNKSYEETNTSTPVFFILSPGVDPIKDVEALGKKLGFTANQKTFHNISLGQGQQTVAEEAMDVAAKDGHWVVLQNIHLGSCDAHLTDQCLIRLSSGQMVTTIGEETGILLGEWQRELSYVHVRRTVG